jgi:hypothetical protein
MPLHPRDEAETSFPGALHSTAPPGLTLGATVLQERKLEELHGLQSPGIRQQEACKSDGCRFLGITNNATKITASEMLFVFFHM